jgi:hypothetical protein
MDSDQPIPPHTGDDRLRDPERLAGIGAETASDNLEDLPEATAAPGTSCREGRGTTIPWIRRHRWAARGLGVVGTAIVTATATAVISPETLGSLFGRNDDAGGGAPVRYETKVSADKAISFSAPETWVAYDTDPLILPEGDGPRPSFPGSALLAATGRAPVPSWGDDGAYVGATSVAASSLGLAGASAEELQQWAEDEAQVNDWGIEGCVPVRGTDPPERSGWIVAGRVWDDCATVQGYRYWEYYAVSIDGQIIAAIAIALRPDSPDEIAETVFESWEVFADRLPSDMPMRGSSDVIP